VTATKLYGPRTADVNDADNSNHTFKEATRIKYEDDGDDAWTGATPVVAFGDITKTTDVDIFSFRNLERYTGPVTFRVMTSGISLLNPKITLLDSRGRVLATRTAAGQVGGADLSITLPKSADRATYFLKVERAAATDPFGIGRFGVAVTLDPRLTTPVAEINQVLRGHYETLDESDLKKLFDAEPADELFEMDDHTDDTVALAERMRADNTLGTAFSAIGSLQDAVDVDFHRARAPRLTTSTPVSATITIAPFQVNGVMPDIQLVNGNGAALPVTVLTNGNGVMVLQSTGLRAGSDYYVRAANAPGQAATGNYQINLRFSTQAVALETFVSGNVPATGASTTLYVAEPQLFHLLLSSANGVGVTMTIRDLANNVVYTLASNGPAASAAPVLLQPGEYRIEFTTAGEAAFVTLKGLPLSDPIGAVVVNPTQTPPYQTPGQPGTNTYPTGTITTKPYLFSSLIS
jgi:hypothetical protein